jgi:hypothetical protein
MLPPAIIFINNDIENSINTLSTQLFIHEIITKQQFDNRMIANPNYAQSIYLDNIRLVVLLVDMNDLLHRDLADVVLFYSHGLIKVQDNKYGPPGNTFNLNKITIFNLINNFTKIIMA